MNNYPNISKQNGMVIILGIIFLLILTILGITAMSSTVVTEKMSQNLREVTTAFGASESALSDGEQWIQNQTSPPSPVATCSTPPCNVWQLDAAGTVYQNTSSWWQSQARPFSTTIGNVSSQPRFVIEQFRFVPYDLSPNSLSTGRGYYYYRVSSRGVGATTNSLILLQSIYAVQYN